MPHKKSRLIAVTTRSWPAVEPLVRAFEGAGFTVALVHGQTRGNRLHDASVIMIPSRPLHFRHAIEHTIQDLGPDLVVPLDGPSHQQICDLHASLTQHGGTHAGAVARIIARSLGDPARHESVTSTAALLRFAHDHGLPVPNAVAVANEAALRTLLASVPLPVILKADGGWAGVRAEAVRGIDAGVAAYHRMTGVGGRAARWLGQNVLLRLPDLLQSYQRPVLLQQHIDGIAAKRLIAARDGHVLGGVSIEPLGGTGPVMAAKFVFHPAMENIAAFVVETLGLSGIIGFNFVLEHGSRRAWLIAVKPHASPISHLVPAGEVNLPQSLHAAFASGTDWRPVTMPVRAAAALPRADRRPGPTIVWDRGGAMMSRRPPSAARTSLPAPGRSPRRGAPNPNLSPAAFRTGRGNGH